MPITNKLLITFISLLIVLPISNATLSPPIIPEDGEYWGYFPEEIPTSVPKQKILTNSTTQSILQRIASPGRKRSERAVIFTTLRLGDAPQEQVIGMIATFCYHLHKHDMLEHTMLITTEYNTWKVLHDRGFPAFLDRSFPRRSAYVNKVKPKDTYNRVSGDAHFFDFTYKKYWSWFRGFRVFCSE